MDGTDYRVFPSLQGVLLGSLVEAKSTSLRNQEHASNKSKANEKQKGPNTGGQGQPAEIRIPTETSGEQMR